MYQKNKCKYSRKEIYLNLFYFFFSKKGVNTSFYLDENFDFDQDISKISKLSNFNNSITVHRVKDMQTMQKLQL